MRPHRSATWRTRLALTALALAATTLIAAPAPAHATPTTASQPVGATARYWDPETRTTRLLPADQAARLIERFWTPQRLAAATPAPIPEVGPDTGRAVTTGPERSIAVPQEALDGGAHVQDGAWYSVTNGKIWWTHPSTGALYWCSGAAINSGKKRIVLTAGHCVYARPGGWVTNWVFIPGYNWGSEPRGRFSAYQFWSSTGWTQNGERNRDFAFVITNTNGSGQRVVDAAGGHGLIVNPGRPYVHIMGHPGNQTNGGEVQYYCWGTTTSWTIFDSGQKLRCNFGGGASGGPWLRDYSSNGLGNAISDTHGIATDGSGDNYGPYFDNHTADIYWQAENASP